MRFALNYKTLKLKDSIVPQVFIKKDEKIIYYDRINSDEARFCISSSDGILSSFEALAGQGIITDNGELYVSRARNNTILIKYSSTGKLEKRIEFEGVFFDFKISDFDEMICLGNINGKTVIKILNRDLKELKTIYPREIFFGSCLYLEKDEIYIGGFDIHNDFLIIKINYIGNILNKWNLGLSDSKKIIGKMLKYKDYFVLLFTNGNESIMFFDSKNNSIKEIRPLDFNVENFSDFNIRGNIISILGEQYIFDVFFDEIINYKSKNKVIGFSFDKHLFSYAYAMYFCSLSKNILSMSKYSALLLIIYYIIFFLFKSCYNSFYTLYFIYIFPILNFIIAFIVSLKDFLIKQKRIEQLLYINQYKDLKYMDFLPIYVSLTFLSFLQFINTSHYSLVQKSFLAFLIYIFFFYVNKSVINHIKNENNSIVVELLKAQDIYINEYVNGVIECLKEKNSEKLSIEFVMDKDSNKAVPLRWQKSRKSIIKSDIKILDDSNKVKTILDFSKRDIKYSRFSILMDFICYIKQQIKVKEIEIEVLDKDSKCEIINEQVKN